MSQRSDGVFTSLVFATNDFGDLAIAILKEFALPSIHNALQAQLPHLVEIHDSGKMPILGTAGQYEWLLAVWSRPSPTQVCLLVWRADRQLMSISEAIQIEREAIGRAGPTAQKCVNIRPHEIMNDDVGKQVWGNIKNDHHWSHGLI